MAPWRAARVIASAGCSFFGTPGVTNQLFRVGDQVVDYHQWGVLRPIVSFWIRIDGCSNIHRQSVPDTLLGLAVLVHEVLVHRHARHGLRYRMAEIGEKLRQFLWSSRTRANVMIRLRHYALARASPASMSRRGTVPRRPGTRWAFSRNSSMRCASDSGISMSRHARQNGVSWRCGDVVVQHDEVADLLDLDARLLVVLVDQSTGRMPSSGNICMQPRSCRAESGECWSIRAAR